MMPKIDMGRSASAEDTVVPELELEPDGDGSMGRTVGFSWEEPPEAVATWSTSRPMPDGENSRPMPWTDPTMVSPKAEAASPVASTTPARTITEVGLTPRKPL